MVEYKLPQGTGLKKPSGKRKMTALQYDIYKKCFDDYSGPLFFAEHCCYVKRNGLQNYSPFDYQREMLFNMHNYQNIISLWSRQNGKTTTSAIYLLWFAMKYPYKDILITSYTETSANEILAMIRLLYENCPDFIKVPIKVANVQSLIFSNNSRIFSRATTLKAARGLSPAYIYCDEFAFVGNGESAQKSLEKQEEFYASISPALSASKGKLAITSTPISESDLFYRMWSGAIRKTDDNGLDYPKDYIISIDGELYRDFHLFKSEDEAKLYIDGLDKDHKYEIVAKDPPGNNGFSSQLVKWDKSPFKDKKWAETERKKIGDDKFEREYNCISGEMMVNIMREDGKMMNISIEDLYNYHMGGNDGKTEKRLFGT